MTTLNVNCQTQTVASGKLRKAMESSEIEDTVNISRYRHGDIDGSILSVHAKNFFCHDNLEINFNRNINFIVGRNGSGKSAILTALVVGLGARATATNRGTNLRSFIKKGANSATIEIKIKNSSDHAFKHDIYGDVITICRTLMASGGSFYKIKNSTGEVISTKHDEVAIICSVHDIQVDNPICVLNQDDARNFHASDAKKKYSLYRKATNMETIDTNYNRALNNCIKSKATIDKKFEAFAELEKELNQLKKKFRDLQSRDEITEELKNVQNEYYWSEICDLQSETKKIEKQCSKQEEKIAKIINEHTNLEQGQDEYKNRISDINERLNEINSKMQDVLVKLDSSLTKFQDIKKEWKLSLNQLQKKKDQISREVAKVNDLQKEIDIAMQNNSIEETENLKRQKSEITSQLEEAQSRKNVVAHELTQVQNAVAHNQTSHDQQHRETARVQSTIRHLKSQMNELNVRGGNNLAIYGNNMIDLVNAVKAAHKNGEFTQMPRGPIGSYLKVHDKKWSGALEHIIGGSIRAFCVDNDRDAKKLFSIMNRVIVKGAKPSITTSSFFNKVHDYSYNAVRAPTGYRSALHCLKIEDPVIANYLIDNFGMESILMVPTHDEAIEFATNETKIPASCSKIVTMDSSEFYPMPNYRSYGGSNNFSQYLQVNTSERKKQLQADLLKAEADYKTAETELQKYVETKNQLESQEQSLGVRLRKLVNGIHHHESKLVSIEASLLNAESGHIKVLTEELDTTKRELSELKNEEKELSQKELETRNFTKEADTAVNDNKILKNKVEEKITNLKEELDAETLNMGKAKSDLKMSHKAMSDEKLVLNDLQLKLSELQNFINDKIKSAEKLCPRIDKPRSLEIVENNLKKLKARLNSMADGGPSKQQVGELLIQKEQVYESTYVALKELSNLINMLKKTTQNHLRCALQIQSITATRVQHCFQSILNLRGYSGSMDINNVNGILDIHCTGRDSASVRVADTTSSLSGGERSYATVAFIMALWDCMELPFYFLDEFDVFMDNVNRKVTMDLLINHAQQNLKRQYVFLTPQDTSTLLATDTITIHRLADPVRKKV